MKTLFLLLFLSLSLLSEQNLPTNFDITPHAAKDADFRFLNPHLSHRPNYVAGQAVSVKLSKDENTLLVLTSGYNRMHNEDGSLDINASSEYVFIYDVSKHIPVQKQVLHLANTFYGISWHPLKDAFFVSGGVDDKILYFTKTNGLYHKEKELKLGHKSGLGLHVKPMASELALNKNGSLLAVSNMENDSVSLIDVKSFTLLDEIDLRPGKNDIKDKAKPGGEFPFGLAFVHDSIYVASMRDYELVQLKIQDKTLHIQERIKVGSQPTRILYDNAHDVLFVANSRSDSISAINTKNNHVIGTFFTVAPKDIFNQTHLKGANPNALRLKGNRLYVSNGGTNSISVLELTYHKTSLEAQVVALYPTGWYPNDLAIKDDMLYVVNGKSLSGSNSGDCRNNLSTAADAKAECTGRNLYTWKTKKAGFLSMKIPSGDEEKRLTQQVAKNNHFFYKDKVNETMSFLQKKIKHIVYIVKENRSYDQVLGDLEIGNGDKSLTLFPQSNTPNHHKLSTEFVTMDNFLDSGSSSNDGWVWTTSGHTTEYTEKNIAINYAKRGLSYDNEGQNRNIPLAHANFKTRQAYDPRVPDDEDLLPGTRDVAAVDGDDETPSQGYIWDKAIKAGLEVRNYGFYCDEERYFLDKNDSAFVRPSEYPFKEKTVQAYANKASLLGRTDIYFRGYDQNYPDLWRYNEFKREFDEYVKKKSFPSLVLLRLPHDHFGSFKTALAGVDTPLKQMADNDYALGLVVESISKSPFADSTLIFVIEDDAQDGADHVSSHRSISFVAGPYIKKHALVSKRYTTVNVLKTIEKILDIESMGLNDALSESMMDVFDINQTGFVYKAEVPKILYKTDLLLPQESKPKNMASIEVDHNRKYWVNAMQGQNFESEDNLDTKKFNKALWKGITGENFPQE
ncbi:hypothetical protein JHD50_02470 [Sulfurimonas sp. MAG313]|nr:hypothetical protein [Sulfurimonas sp. MAG313]MDF1880176.1 hypothetical protein [Sulfurimonas sp. MAG313]